MSIFDIVLIILFVLIVIHSCINGLVHELENAAWLILGLLLSFSYYRALGLYIREKTLQDVPYLPEILAFAALFLCAAIVIKLIGGLLKGIIEGSGLNFIDRALGLAFGLLKGVIIIAFIIFILRVQPLEGPKKLLKNSVVARVLSPKIEEVKERAQSTDVIGSFDV